MSLAQGLFTGGQGQQIVASRDVWWFQVLHVHLQAIALECGVVRWRQNLDKAR
jgi:hypothetical protein